MVLTTAIPWPDAWLSLASGSFKAELRPLPLNQDSNERK
jgi:hypothetical protein